MLEGVTETQHLQCHCSWNILPDFPVMDNSEPPSDTPTNRMGIILPNTRRFADTAHDIISVCSLLPPIMKHNPSPMHSQVLHTNEWPDTDRPWLLCTKTTPLGAAPTLMQEPMGSPSLFYHFQKAPLCRLPAIVSRPISPIPLFCPSIPQTWY